MKRLLTLAVVLSPGFLVAQKPQAKPSDFPLTVHVVYSRAALGPCAECQTYHLVETVINGQQVELTAGGQGVLALGDYPARTARKSAAPKNNPIYDIFQAYDLLMPDGQVRTYQVTGLGPNATNP